MRALFSRKVDTFPRPIAVVVGCFVLLAVINSFRLPLWEGMDEHRHLTRARDFGAGRINFTASEFRTVHGTGVEYHPPLYYAMIAPVVNLTDGPVEEDPSTILGFPKSIVLAHRAARLPSSLMGAVTLVAIYLLIRRLLLDDRLATAVAAFTALTPSFVMTGSSVNDDAAGVMFSSLLLLSICHVVVAARASVVSILVMIVLLTLSLLCKTAALALAPVVAAATVLWLWRRSRLLLTTLGVATAGAAIGGWWILQIGAPGATGRFAWVMGGRWVSSLGTIISSLRSLTPDDVLETLDRLFTTYWGFAGFQTIEPLPAPERLLLALFGALVVFGLVMIVARRTLWQELPSRNKMACLVLGGGTVLMLIEVLLKDWAPGDIAPGTGHARYMLPVVGLISAVFVSGMLAAAPARLRSAVFASTIFCLFVAYATAPFSGASSSSGPLAAVDELPPSLDVNRPVASFDKGIDLVGYSLASDSVAPGERVALSLYWRARENRGEAFVAFVHLVAPDGTALLKDDQVPTLHRFPPNVWRAGDVVRDVRLLEIPTQAAAGIYEAQVGIYAGSKRVPYLVIGGQTDRPQESRLSLGDIKVRPASVDPATITSPTDVVFGDAVGLAGYNMTAVQGNPAKLEITLFWRARGQVTSDYTASIQLLDHAGRLIGQVDKLAGGSYPSTMWEPGEIVADRRELTLDESPPLERCSVALAVYALPDGKRLPIKQGDALLDTDLLHLAGITLR